MGGDKSKRQKLLGIFGYKKKDKVDEARSDDGAPQVATRVSNTRSTAAIHSTTKKPDVVESTHEVHRMTDKDLTSTKARIPQSADKSDADGGEPGAVTKAVGSASSQSSDTIAKAAKLVDKKDISYRLWTLAYEILKDEQPELLDVYEIILSEQLIDGPQAHSTTNLFDDENNKQRRVELMQKIVENVLEKTQKHSEIRGAVIGTVEFLNGINGIMTAVLQSYPPASLAWTGLCTILPVIVRPFTAKEAMIEGIQHVIERIEWYMMLARLLFREDDNDNPTFEAFQDLVERRIISLYQALLEFQVLCVCQCYHTNRLVAAFKHMLGKVDWQARLDDLKASEANVDAAAEQHNVQMGLGHLRSIACHGETLLSMASQMKMLVLANDRERRNAQSDLIGRLSTTPYARQMQLNPKRIPETCEWFTSHPNFREWLDADKSSLLLVSADPGCGKSVLARYLIEDFLPKDSPNAIVSYFFFKDTPEQTQLVNGLCAVVHGLFDQSGDLVDACQDKIRKGGPILTSDSKTLWELLLKASEVEGAPTIICVLDALDECTVDSAKDGSASRDSSSEGRKALIQMLLSYYASEAASRSRALLKFLVTTRPYPDILQEFQRHDCGYIRLAGEGKEETDQIREEIDKVLHYRLDELARDKGLRPELKGLIADRLIAKSADQRTYLWVRLIFESMEHHLDNTARGWKILIDELPTTVAGAYENLLANVAKNTAPAIRTMLGLILAAFRPLTLRELNIALNVRVDLGQSSEDDLDMMDDDDFRTWIIGTCGFFVNIYDGRVYLIHQTAKEFLLETSGPRTGGRGGAQSKDGTTESLASRGSSSQWRGSFNEAAAHAIMAESCISYLCLDEFTKANPELDKHIDSALYWRNRAGWDDFVRRFRFMTYTIIYWQAHFSKAQVFEQQDKEAGLLRLVRGISDEYFPWYSHLFDPEAAVFSRWAALWARAQESSWWLNLLIYRPNSDPDVMGGETHSRADIAGNVREKSEDNNREDEFVADVQKDDDESRAARRRPSYSSSQDSLNQLFESSLVDAAQVDFEFKSINHPVNVGLLAAQSGHFHVLQKAVEQRELRVSSRVEVANTAVSWREDKDAAYLYLFIASGSGHTECVSYLLGCPHLRDRGVHLRDDDDGRTALHIAAAAGQLGPAKVLLDHGAEPNALDKTKKTPLRLCLTGTTLRSPQMPHLLLERGADPHARYDGSNDSLLHWAAAQMHGFYDGPSVQLSGIHATRFRRLKDYPDTTRGYPDKTKPSLVATLVEHGADINARNEDGDTPLHFACERGHLETFICLLKLGADPSVTNSQGEAPLHVALRRDLRDVALVLCHADAPRLMHGPQGMPLTKYAGGWGVLDALVPFEDLGCFAIPLAEMAALDKAGEGDDIHDSGAAHEWLVHIEGTDEESDEEGSYKEEGEEEEEEEEGGWEEGTVDFEGPRRASTI